MSNDEATAAPPQTLVGKRILVTGAASGIGHGAAAYFLAAGARIVVSDRDEEQLCSVWRGKGQTALLRLDVTDEADCQTAVSAAVDALGGIDGVFNSAGISDVVAKATDIPIDAWQRVIDVNLRGSFLVARTAGRHMIANGGGSIVLVSSVNGLSGIPRRHAYGPSKAAVAQLARTLACEWGNLAVRVNSVAPTYIRTPMIDRLSAAGKIDIGRLEKRTPMARIGEVEDVAKAAAFLLSDMSDYITGVTLPVDGGWLAYGGPGDVETA